jgi:hypothetical protein
VCSVLFEHSLGFFEVANYVDSYVLVTGLSLWENDVDTGHASSPYNGTVYTAYLVGRYLAFVEHIKKQSSDSLDLGYPAADRVLLNSTSQYNVVAC